METRKHIAAEKKRCESHNCAQAVLHTYALVSKGGQQQFNTGAIKNKNSSTSSLRAAAHRFHPRYFRGKHLELGGAAGTAPKAI